MDEPDSAAAVIENADFADTDIPIDFHIPQRPYVPEDKREEVRNYVLELSMDQQVEQTLGMRSCEFCGVDTYEANLSCHNCKNKWEPCAVTGGQGGRGVYCCSSAVIVLGVRQSTTFGDNWV